MRDGARVAFLGDDRLGDEGVVLDAGNTGSSVKWDRTGEIRLESNRLLVEITPRDRFNESIDDCLDTPGLTTFAVAETMERSGPEGVFAQMAEEGHINLLADMAEEAIDLVASKLRRDPSFREVLGMMEDEDGDVFVRYAATHLLRENLTEEE
jgi:hypothetical protein